MVKILFWCKLKRHFCTRMYSSWPGLNWYMWLPDVNQTVVRTVEAAGFAVKKVITVIQHIHHQHSSLSANWRSFPSSARPWLVDCWFFFFFFYWVVNYGYVHISSESYFATYFSLVDYFPSILADSVKTKRQRHLQIFFKDIYRIVVFGTKYQE